MRSNGYTAPFISGRSAVIGAFQSCHCFIVLLVAGSSAGGCCTVFLLCLSFCWLCFVGLVLVSLLSWLTSALTGNLSLTAKTSTHIASTIAGEKIQEHKIIVSSDVQSLFTYHGGSRTTETGKTSSNHGALEFRFKINVLPVQPLWVTRWPRLLLIFTI